MHWQRWRKYGSTDDPRRPLSDRFWSKVAKTETCWLWTASLDGSGYGQFFTRVEGQRKSNRAHRLAYELVVGPIPEGLVLDHLCRNPKCVNPEHLEPVTDRENILRGTGLSARRARQVLCAEGRHRLDDFPRQASGQRSCLACRNVKRRGKAV